MSYSFRQRLKIAIAKDLRERLGLSQADIDYIKDNIMKICPVSDEVAKALQQYDHRFKGKSLDEIIDMMTDAQFEDFVKEVLEIAFKKLGYKKKKEKKKQKESESDSESDSDSDTDGSTEPVEEQEAEVECTEKNE